MQRYRTRLPRDLVLGALSAALFACGGNVIADGIETGASGSGSTSGSSSSSGPSTSSGPGSSSSSGVPTGPWESLNFEAMQAITPCVGARFVTFSDEYGKWVGAILCSPTRYKLFLSDGKEGLYSEIADGGGHGQDHCEFVNPTFTLTSDDDIKSGGCDACDLSSDYAVPISGQGYVRSGIGEQPEFMFELGQGYYTPTWYECGVSIP